MASITTIGNAALITYEANKPILVADPWLGEEDEAYFGSWNLSHEIPHSYKQDILNSRYVWFSHGHQDHLNSFSIKTTFSFLIFSPLDISCKRISKLTKSKFPETNKLNGIFFLL